MTKKTNEELAFELTLKTMKDYVQKCDKQDDIINPIEATYLLTNSLASALLFKAEGHTDECLTLIHEAVNDAFLSVKETI